VLRIVFGFALLALFLQQPGRTGVRPAERQMRSPPFIRAPRAICPRTLLDSMGSCPGCSCGACCSSPGQASRFSYLMLTSVRWRGRRS
jgi:hypothetical protein